MLHEAPRAQLVDARVRPYPAVGVHRRRLVLAEVDAVLDGDTDGAAARGGRQLAVDRPEVGAPIHLRRREQAHRPGPRDAVGRERGIHAAHLLHHRREDGEQRAAAAAVAEAHGAHGPKVEVELGVKSAHAVDLQLLEARPAGDAVGRRRHLHVAPAAGGHEVGPREEVRPPAEAHRAHLAVVLAQPRRHPIDAARRRRRARNHEPRPRPRELRRARVGERAHHAEIAAVPRREALGNSAKAAQGIELPATSQTPGKPRENLEKPGKHSKTNTHEKRTLKPGKQLGKASGRPGETPNG